MKSMEDFKFIHLDGFRRSLVLHFWDPLLAKSVFRYSSFNYAFLSYIFYQTFTEENIFQLLPWQYRPQNDLELVHVAMDSQ